MMSTRKSYLGDSVYVDFDGYMLTLTTENGYDPSNTIYLEPEVYQQLTEYVKKIREELEADAEADRIDREHRKGP